jgi:hypothetical protein
MTTVRWESTCTIHYYETSPLDVSRAWFSAGDFKEFKQRSKILARIAQEIGADALETYCNDSYRGLEYILDGENREIRNTRKEIAWTVVLENLPDALQENSADKGNLAWKRITMMYSAVSSDALKDAQISAAQDAMSLGFPPPHALGKGVGFCEVLLSSQEKMIHKHSCCCPRSDCCSSLPPSHCRC